MKKISYALKHHRKKCKEKPWFKTLCAIRVRCDNKEQPYYKKGIKNFLTLEDLKILWFRDRAYLLKIPSIHRIDNSRPYCIENCCYIELSKNIREGNLGIKKSEEHRKKIMKNLWWYPLRKIKGVKYAKVI